MESYSKFTRLILTGYELPLLVERSDSGFWFADEPLASVRNLPHPLRVVASQPSWYMVSYPKFMRLILDLRQRETGSREELGHGFSLLVQAFAKGHWTI